MDDAPTSTFNFPIKITLFEFLFIVIFCRCACVRVCARFSFFLSFFLSFGVFVSYPSADPIAWVFLTRAKRFNVRRRISITKTKVSGLKPFSWSFCFFFFRSFLFRLQYSEYISYNFHGPTRHFSSTSTPSSSYKIYFQRYGIAVHFLHLQRRSCRCRDGTMDPTDRHLTAASRIKKKKKQSRFYSLIPRSVSAL